VQKHNFSGVLFGFETRSVALREEHCMGMFESRVLKTVFGRGNKRLEINYEFDGLKTLFPDKIIRMMKSGTISDTERISRMRLIRN
jgi:hypothetical protein